MPRFPSPKKYLSQHFLHDSRVLDRVVDVSALSGGDVVLEIGAGTGELTRRLSERVGEKGRVFAVELDRDLLPLLEEMAERLKNVRVVSGDILKLDLHRLLEEEGLSPPIAIVGNLPYAITTPILERLLEVSPLWSSATFMVQEEVARRLATPPGEPGCGSISVFVHSTAEVSYCFRVGEGAFTPPPRVRSAVIRLKPWEIPPITVKDRSWLFRLSRAAFGRRRKTLLNALSSLPFDRETLRQLLESAGIDPQRRGETLSLDEFARIADAFATKTLPNDET